MSEPVVDDECNDIFGPMTAEELAERVERSLGLAQTQAATSIVTAAAGDVNDVDLEALIGDIEAEYGSIDETLNGLAALLDSVENTKATLLRDVDALVASTRRAREEAEAEAAARALVVTDAGGQEQENSVAP